MEDQGVQHPHWQNFYEAAWQERGNILRDCLKQGMNAHQACKRLAAIERKSGFIFSSRNKSSWKPNFTGEEEGFFKPLGVPLSRVASYCGQFVKSSYYSIFSVRDLLVDFIDMNSPYDSIIELGCGYGRNLFDLYYGGGPLNAQYFGGEFTSSGVSAGNELAKAAEGMNATFFHFNHLDPELNIEAGQRALVFTCHTIEQIWKLPEKWFSVVAGIAPSVTCIHLEPFGFQIQDSGPITPHHRKFMQDKGWNQNFVSVLRSADKKGVIQLKSICLEAFLSAEPVNPTSLAIWEANKTS